MSNSEYEATNVLEWEISHFLDCDDVDSWRVKKWTGNNLDIGAFLSFVGYRKKEFSQDWCTYSTRRVKCGSHSEISGYSGDADENGHVELKPVYETVDDYEDEEYISDSGTVTETVYYLVTPKVEECRKLRDEFTSQWLTFYCKNQMREYPDGYYLDIKKNLLDRSKFHFWKEEEVKNEVRHDRRVNLPFFLLSVILPFVLALAFLFSVDSFSFSDFSSLKGLVVFTDTFLDLNGNFNYVLFYPIWAGVTALHIVCCIYYGYYYGENIKWWLLIFFLVILILGPLISTIVFYGITGKNSGFDFFALILATFSLFLGLIVFLVLFIDRVTIKRRTFKLRRKENWETKELMDYFIDFERKGMIGEYKGYLKRWLAITGGED